MPVWLARIMAWFGGDIIRKIIACLPTIVVKVEDAMKDGKIDANERKEIAMLVVKELAKQFSVTINPLMMWVISTLIDMIAKKLPSKDFNVPAVIQSVVAEYK